MTARENETSAGDERDGREGGRDQQTREGTSEQRGKEILLYAALLPSAAAAADNEHRK